jgi:hypothetical protein
VGVLGAGGTVLKSNSGQKRLLPIGGAPLVFRLSTGTKDERDYNNTNFQRLNKPG